MTTRNLSKSFKGKINGKRLPPIPVTNEQSTSSQPPPPTTTTSNKDSILKQSKPLTEGVPSDNHMLSPDEDDPDSSRIIFQKSQADVLLLLDTYPPKTWTVPKCLRASYDNALGQSRTSNPIFDTLISCNNEQGDLIDVFPSPISDRLPSSRYCRRSVSSACSRRSSILFQRHSNLPVDLTQFPREDTFDTVFESLTATARSAYTPLPPIPTDTVTTFAKSITVPSADLPPSISPPLVTAEESPTIQEKKNEFTRRLLSKSLHRESTALSTDTTMNYSTTVQKTPTVKLIVASPLQKPIVESRREDSVEQSIPAVANRNKMPATTCSISANTNQQRLKKIPLDIFQPQSKSNTTTTAINKKSITANNKIKTSTKINQPKLKISPNIPQKETIKSKNDVIPSPLTASTVEATQMTNAIKTEDLPSSVVNIESVSSPNEQPEADVPTELKRQFSSRTGSHYSIRCSHPVPKPLTLQGEKLVETDYLQPSSRIVTSSTAHCRRRGSLKDQPLITELFPDSTIETKHSVVKPEPIPPTKSVALKMKWQRSNFIKNSKVKKPIIANKPKKPMKTVEKTAINSENTNTEIKETNQNEKQEEHTIAIGGTDWMMNVKPQVLKEEGGEFTLSQLSQVSTVDDEEIPSCASPIDHLETSQTTIVTNTNDELRRNSTESIQAIEISPVLTQVIEHSTESISQLSMQAAKVNESSLVNSDIRTVYETVKDSVRKDTSLRSLSLKSNEQETPLIVPSSTTSLSSNNKTLPFEASDRVSHTYNNSEIGHSVRPALRVVNDSLNSRGSETIDSTSSQEDCNTTPLCTENDCDEIYRTARKGRQIGRGAYGIVWSYLTTSGKVIAVKEIELDEGDYACVHNDYEAVREEIHILRTLNHPYVVKFLGISLENERLVKIFMEYLPSGTIENLLASFSPFHNDVLRKYTQQLAEGVAYLHDNDVVHRDIKGKNIMLDGDGNIKLIDFGCAKRLKKNQNTHSMRQILKSMKGTANWMAPEVITETGHGKKADIWSIGCTLCEMATGKPPWSSEPNHLAVLLIIANGTKPPADLPDTCPATAQDFFRLCLTRDPSARPSAKDLLKHPFFLS